MIKSVIQDRQNELTKILHMNEDMEKIKENLEKCLGKYILLELVQKGMEGIYSEEYPHSVNELLQNAYNFIEEVVKENKDDCSINFYYSKLAEKPNLSLWEVEKLIEDLSFEFDYEETVQDWQLKKLQKGINELLAEVFTRPYWSLKDTFIESMKYKQIKEELGKC